MAGNRIRHPVFARAYTRASGWLDRAGAAEHRRRLLADLSGRVIEVGAGDGRNFAHYPPNVTAVVAVEPEPALWAAAARAAAVASVPVLVVGGVADALAAADGAFDAAVSSLVLCSVPDQAAALTEIGRVLRPGGQLRFFEHVVADAPGVRRLQRIVDATVWPGLFGGCHTGRDTLTAIQAAGFDLERVDRFRLPGTALAAMAASHVLGVAVHR